MKNYKLSENSTLFIAIFSSFISFILLVIWFLTPDLFNIVRHSLQLSQKDFFTAFGSAYMSVLLFFAFSIFWWIPLSLAINILGLFIQSYITKKPIKAKEFIAGAIFSTIMPIFLLIVYFLFGAFVALSLR